MQNLTSKTWFQFLVALRKGRVVHEIFMLSINWKVQFYSQQNAMFILLQEGGRIAAVSTLKVSTFSLLLSNVPRKHYNMLIRYLFWSVKHSKKKSQLLSGNI